MNTENSSDRGILSPMVLHVLLGMSILTNIILLARLSYPHAIENFSIRMQAPPVVTSGDHIRGNPNAKGSAIIYMDFQCPYCAKLHEDMLVLYKQTNIRWIYRHFPLASHPYAEKAAEAAECAGAQGKFWEYTDGLFDSDFKIEADSSFAHLASAVGVNGNAFDACLSSGKFANLVDAQREDGIRRKISGTPTFFVNGRRFDGMIPPEELRKALEQ